MKNKFLFLSLSFLLTLVSSCSTNPNTQTSLPSESPSYEGGLEGNQADDTFDNEDNDEIVDVLTAASKITKYTYEVEVNVSGTYEKFTQYFTPNAWYTEGGSDADFGYAQTKKDKYLFKYYINDDATEVYPSVYEYGGYYTNDIIQDLYSALTIADISLVANTLSSLKEDGYQYLGANNYIILDDSTMSVFQFMTTYGSSIASFINAFYIQIIDVENCIFETTLDLGSYGSIVGKFTPQETTKIDFVNDAVLNDGLEGVLSNDKISQVSELLQGNNFTMKGITLVESNGNRNNPTATAYCTNDYFLYDFVDPSYSDFGFAFIKANTKVMVYQEDDNNVMSDTATEYQYDYDGCYKFRIDENGNVKFSRFIGPIENESTQYKYVETLPQVGETGVLYICKDSTGATMVYEYAETDSGYEWKVYSEWYDTVGDFYLYNYGATLYPGSTAFTALAPSLFEKVDPADENENNFFTSNSDITSALANGIFGWGFQSSTTWMDYITNAYMDINFTDTNEIESVDLGLGVQATVGGNSGEQKIYYNYSNFGTTKVDAVDKVINALYGEE